MNIKAIAIGILVGLYLIIPTSGLAETEQIMVDKDE